MTTSFQRIARLYDLHDLPFERRRCRAIRPQLFRGMADRVLDAGIGTGRNCECCRPQLSLPSTSFRDSGMLARAHDRCRALSANHRLFEMDVMKFPNDTFDAAGSFTLMPVKNLSEKFLETCKCAPGQALSEYRDANVRGLEFRVSAKARLAKLQ
jgi:ubiquinone/menaquinone biosynthesis C-methylase UbiE